MADLPDLFAVGFAKAEITPPLSVPYLSWNPRHQAFAGVHDPLLVRALVVGAGRERVAVLSFDLIGLADTVLDGAKARGGGSAGFVGRLRAAVSRATGIAETHVLLAATHAHSTPETLGFRALLPHPGASEWVESVIERAGACAAAAARDCFAARLRSGSVRVPGVAVNRRGEGHLDEELTVLCFEACEGGRRVAVVHFACHPVIVQVQPQVSADFPGVLCRELERQGVEAVFLQGACGDINPAVGDSRRFEDVEAVGQRLARSARGVLDSMTRTHRAVVGSERLSVSLPSRALPSREEVAGVHPPHICEEYEVRVREGTEDFAAELQVVRLGESLLFAMPGEPFTQLGLELRRMAGPLIGLPVGFANGYLGYFVPSESWEKGGYETVPGPWSKVSAAGSRVIREAFAAGVEKPG